MKLISCHIENFGRLSNLDMDFTNGVNSIMHDNGWGKSTFASFIKAMFYGLEGGKKRSLENERTRFSPWQKGHFGGSLTFEVQSRRYTVTREFGKKESEDTFELINAITNLQSTDYSANLGVEIFQVDADSFKRTVYISQEDAEYKGTTSGISAKLGNLTDNTDDMNNYDTADQKLKDYLNQWHPTHSTGKLYKLKDEIAALKKQIEEEPVIERKIQDIERLKDEASDRRRALIQKQSKMLETQRVLIAIRARKVKQEQLEKYYEAENARDAAVSEERLLFGGDIPERTEITDISEQIQSLTRDLAGMENFRLDDNEIRTYRRVKGLYANNLPSEEDIKKNIQVVEEVRQINEDMKAVALAEDEAAELERLHEKFRVGIPTEEEVDDKIRVLSGLKTKYAQCHMIEDNLMEEQRNYDEVEASVDSKASEENDSFQADEHQETTVRYEIEKLENEIHKRSEAQHRKTINLIKKNKSRHIAGSFLLIIAVIFAVAAFIIRNNSMPLCIAFGGLAAAALVAGLVMVLSKLSEEEVANAKEGSDIKELEKKKEELEKTREELLIKLRANEATRAASKAGRDTVLAGHKARIDKYKEQIEEVRSQVSIEEQKISDFLAIFGESFSVDTAEQKLYDVRTDVTLYEKLMNKKETERAGDRTKEIEEKFESIKEFLKGFYDTTDLKQSELEQLFEDIREDAESYRTLTEKKRRFDEYTENSQKEEALIRAFFARINPKGYEDEELEIDTFAKVLSDISSSLIKYDAAVAEYKKAKKEREQFEADNPDVRRLGDGDESNESMKLSDDGDSIDKNLVDNQLEQIARDLDQERNNMSAYDRSIDEAYDALDKIEELKSERDRLQAEFEEGMHKYELVKKAREILGAAKEQFTARFMKPIMDRFEVYYGLLEHTGIEEEGNLKQFKIDANANLTKREEGAYRAIETQSTGLRDMFGVCMRMALIDVMYENEKPIILFDDPFVNLDGDKTVGAMKMLEEIGKDYQIIYFTCHESRKV